MLIMLIRTVILYILVVVALRLMGKQQISQLQPFEFVITLMIAELATIPMEDTGIPLLKGIIPIFLLLVFQVIFSFVSLKNQKFRRFICGTPSILIYKGKIKEKEMVKNRYNINDLLEQLRLKSYPNINEIEYAFLETNGDLSVVPKSDYKTVTLKDLNIPSIPAVLPLTLVVDGILQTQNIKLANYDEKLLLQQLKGFKIKEPKDALIAIIDSAGNFYAQPKNNIAV